MAPHLLAGLWAEAGQIGTCSYPYAWHQKHYFLGIVLEEDDGK